MFKIVVFSVLVRLANVDSICFLCGSIVENINNRWCQKTGGTVQNSNIAVLQHFIVDIYETARFIILHSAANVITLIQSYIRNNSSSFIGTSHMDLL